MARVKHTVTKLNTPVYVVLHASSAGITDYKQQAKVSTNKCLSHLANEVKIAGKIGLKEYLHK